MADEERCGNCRFYFGDVDAEDGICRRHPPQVIVSVDRTKLLSRFPPVSPTKGWCGEYKPRTH